MSSTDFLPKKDGDLVPWTDNFIQVATANIGVIGLEPKVFEDLTLLKTAYSTGLTTATVKAADSTSATKAKNTKRKL